MTQARTSSSRGEGRDARDARIGPGARVRGRIHGDGDLVVEGQVDGDVALRGDLTIAAGGSVVTKTLEARGVTIAGTLEGDVAAEGQVSLVAGARVRGNLKGSSVSIDEGARFAGRLECEFDLPPELSGGATGASGAPARARAGARR